MGRTRALLESYRSLGLLLLVVAALAATIVASCGSGGGGSSNGDLCEQCGDDPDGPCQASGFVVPGATKPEPCPTVAPSAPGACVSRALFCLRGADTAQRRCYPAGATGGVDPFFRCNGQPPGPTLLPPSVTPTSTALTPTPVATPVCGNNVREAGEQCDGVDVGTATCESQGCDIPGGILSCQTNCTFNFVTCANGGFGCGS